MNTCTCCEGDNCLIMKDPYILKLLYNSKDGDNFMVIWCLLPWINLVWGTLLALILYENVSNILIIWFFFEILAVHDIFNPRLLKGDGYQSPLMIIFRPAKTLNFTSKWVWLILGSSFPVI